MQNSGSYLRQFSKRAWKSESKQWGGENELSSLQRGKDLNQMEGFNDMFGNEHENAGVAVRKRVMVVVDRTSHSRHAMMWALSHVVNKCDVLTLLLVVPPHETSDESSHTYLANYLGTLCKESKPEVEVEALVIEGPKFDTVVSQVKKLEVSVLVLGQRKPSILTSCFCGTSSSEDFAEQCINNAECLTVGVRKRSQGTDGYFISTRWQKNFWLLA